MHVVADQIDPWLAYRLIPPGYGIWNAMGIYQRCLENFTEKPIMENRLTEYNCMNCHTFQNGNPNKMAFHIRGRHGGSVLIENQQVSKIVPKMPEGLKGIAYPHWHPTHDYITFASDQVAQSFYANHYNRIEVYDTRSDVVVYDTKTGVAHTAPYMSDPGAWETFPAFSADGKTLYWSAADTVPSPYPIHYNNAHFSVFKTTFDPETCTFGEKKDTLLYAGDSTSFAYPRESPDGRWMVYNQYDYGYFPINHQEGDLHIMDMKTGESRPLDEVNTEHAESYHTWHQEGDLHIMDMKTGESRPLDEVNTEHAESYHTWSRNSRWLVYSSRRMDGLFVRAYFAYVDENGQNAGVWEQHRGCLWIGKSSTYLACISKHEKMTTYVKNYIATKLGNPITQVKPPKSAIDKCTNFKAISRIVLQGKGGEKTIVSRAGGITFEQEEEIQRIRAERIDTSGRRFAYHGYEDW